MVAIKVRGLSKAFGPKVVLDKVDIDIVENESLVIIGGSGSGKSVFIKCLFGIIQPDHGEVELWGKNFYKSSPSEIKEIMSKVGVLFQGGALFDSLKIWENVSFSLIHNHGWNAKKAKDLAVEKLALVGLGSHVADLHPAELSGGMQKRAALARTIATNPKIIFFDEPTSGLDPINTNVINELITKCSKELGATTVTITHDMGSANKIADQAAMIYNGKIIWLGKNNELYNSGNPYVDQFVHGNTRGPIQIEAGIK